MLVSWGGASFAALSYSKSKCLCHPFVAVNENSSPVATKTTMANGALLLAANPAMQLWRPTATKQTTIEPQSLEVARGAATGEETKKECNCGGREGYEGGSSAC